MPVPGGELMARVAGGADREAFLWSGHESVRELERTLAVVGRSLDSFESILDFGCGCGRMLLWMGWIGESRALYGTAIDAQAIAWCREHLPYANVTVNDPDPPLPYPDEAFDLVFNHSVFTHIDERRQDLWLAELQRVTRPGGLVVLSVHGEVALPEGAWEIRDRLERDGIAFQDGTMPAGIALPDWYQNTWHAPWYVFEHWGRWFEIRGYLPGADLGFQDHVLMERRQDNAHARDPVAARPRLPARDRPAARVEDALATARGYRTGPGKGNAGFRPLRHLARRLVLRVIRPYTVHEDKFDEAVATSIAELTRVSDHYGSVLAQLQGKHRDSERD